MSSKEKIQRAIDMAVQFGGIDGAHHKAWVIDQMVRRLTGCVGHDETEEYQALVLDACNGADGPETYSWDVGIPP